GGKPLGGDVHYDPKGKGWVLLRSAFPAHGDRLTKGIYRQSCSTPKNAEQGVTDCHEVPDLGHEFNDTVGALRQGHQPRDVESQDDAVLLARDGARRPRVENGGGRLCRARRLGKPPWVNAFDD